MEEMFPTVMEMPIDVLPQILNKKPRRTHSRSSVNNTLEKFNILNNIASVKEANSEIGVVRFILYYSGIVQNKN